MVHCCAASRGHGNWSVEVMESPGKFLWKKVWKPYIPLHVNVAGQVVYTNVSFSPSSVISLSNQHTGGKQWQGIHMLQMAPALQWWFCWCNILALYLLWFVHLFRWMVTMCWRRYCSLSLSCICFDLLTCVTPLFSTWPHLNGDVGLEEGEY